MKKPIQLDANQERTFEAEIAVASSFSPPETPLDDVIRTAIWRTLYRDEPITDELREYARNVIAENPRYATAGAGLASVTATLDHMITCYKLNHG